MAEHAVPLWNTRQQEMLLVAAHRCWPSNTKTFSKGKNQADTAAGELPAQAGLGKQCSAHGQVGGSTAPLQRGGAGEGNPVKGSHSSASSAEARSTGLPQKCGQVNSSRWLPREQKVGALSMTRVQPSTAQPSACLLLCCPCLRTMGKAHPVHCPVGLLAQE